VIKFSAPFPVVKQKHVSGNTVVSSKPQIRNKDDRNFSPKMTFFRTLKPFREFGMFVNPFGRTKPPNKKGCNLNGLEDEGGEYSINQ